MEMAAGDCWVTVTGNVTLSTEQLQCKICKIKREEDKYSCTHTLKMHCSRCHRYKQRLLTIRFADWSVQLTLSIAEAALIWRLLSKVIWMELWQRQRKRKMSQTLHTRKRKETWRWHRCNSAGIQPLMQLTSSWVCGTCFMDLWSYHKVNC